LAIALNKKGFKCLDISAGCIYISHDVVFDEGVYPFSKLHPNARARLWEEISLLPSHLLMPVPHSSYDGVCLTNNPCLIDFPNHASESADGTGNSEEGGENSDENDADRGENDTETNPIARQVQERSSLVDTGSTSDPVIDSALVSGRSNHISALDRVPWHDFFGGEQRSTAVDTDLPRDSGLVPPAHGTVPSQEHASNSGCTASVVPRENVLLGSSVVETGAQHNMITQAQHGIIKPKSYTDGTIRYGLLTTTGEPTSVQEALGDPNWKKAMNSEFASLQANKTWHLVPPKKNVNVICCKWVYKIKRKSDGTIDRYKA
jgi:hypothetical protein